MIIAGAQSLQAACHGLHVAQFDFWTVFVRAFELRGQALLSLGSAACSMLADRQIDMVDLPHRSGCQKKKNRNEQCIVCL